jgi:hypothetical protein
MTTCAIPGELSSFSESLAIAAAAFQSDGDRAVCVEPASRAWAGGIDGWRDKEAGRLTRGRRDRDARARVESSQVKFKIKFQVKFQVKFEFKASMNCMR